MYVPCAYRDDDGTYMDWWGCQKWTHTLQKKNNSHKTQNVHNIYTFLFRYSPPTAVEKKQKKKRVVSGKRRKERKPLVLTDVSLSFSLSFSQLLKQTLFIFSTRKRASFFVSDTREKKWSPPRKRDPPRSVLLPPLFDRPRDLPLPFDRRRLKSERWKVRNLFFLSSSLFFEKMCVGFWRERRALFEMFRE